MSTTGRGEVPLSPNTAFYRDGTSSAGHTKRMGTERGRLLASGERRLHPNAQEKRCQIVRPHVAHPYGRIHEHGGLSKWCEGRS